MTKPNPNAAPTRPRPPNPDDAWIDELRTSCARAMHIWLAEALNTQRPIQSLTKPELCALAEACTAHWIVRVSKYIADEKLSPTRREYVNLLLA